MPMFIRNVRQALLPETNAQTIPDGSVEYKDKMNGYRLTLSDDQLSRHIMMIGEHGCGKTNTIELTVDQLDSEHHKVLIFDPKGDYRKEFFRPNKDILLSGNPEDANRMQYWNLFREIEFSSRYLIGKKQCMKEMVKSFFNGKENQSQPFFSSAGEALFTMILENQLRMLWDNEEYRKLQKIIEKDTGSEQASQALEMERKMFQNLVDLELNNARLAEIMQQASLDYFRELLGKKFPRVYGYLGEKGNYTTGLSVIGEMQSVYEDLFQNTMFEQYQPGRDFAICDFINYGHGRLFIEYSISAGEALGPVYSVIIDCAIKTQLNNYDWIGNNLYLVLDELKMAPVKHLQDAANYGRGLGLRLICGIQSIEQLMYTYGEYEAKVLMESFSTIFAYQMSGASSSREYVVNRLGQKGSFPVARSLENELTVVDENIILQLSCGHMICKPYGHLYPIHFSFEEYQKKELDDARLLREFNNLF